MEPLAALSDVVVWVAGALLVLAGVAKLRWPGGTVAALGDARLPGTPALVRVLGAAEVTTGAGVLLVGGWPPAAAAAVLYTAFAVFVVRQGRSAGGSCGCFGEERTPVSGLHVVVNVVAAGGSVVAATTVARPPLTAVGTADVAVLGGTLVLVAVGAWLVRLGLTAGADLQAALALHPRSERS